MSSNRISVTEAHQRFGDLARIRNGITTWIEVEVPGGVWKPVFEHQFHLAGYEFEPLPFELPGPCPVCGELGPCTCGGKPR